MVKKRTQRFITLLMTLIFTMTFFSPYDITYAAEVDSSVLINLTTTIEQDGSEIAPGGTLTSDAPVDVNISFGVPVQGDDPTPSTPIQKGDTVTLQLSDAFTIVDASSIELKMGGTKVGTVTFDTDTDTSMVTATITFDGDDSIFDGTVNNVYGEFSSEFEYITDGSSGDTGDHTVTILENTYTVNVPEVPIDYEVTKSGTVDLATQSVAWTVNVSATQGGTPIDLDGYEFYDDLLSVGEYIPSTFQVDGSDVAVNTANDALSYVFPSGSTSPKTITFETKIPDDQYYSSSAQSITNIAKLLDSESNEMDQGQDKVNFTPTWIEKTGDASDDSVGAYNPSGRTITWSITANHMEAALNNVVITDELLGGLTFNSATWQEWNGSAWGVENAITPNGSGEYAIGDISSMILLKIVSNVPDDTYTSGTTTYSNSASIRWDTLPGDEPGTGSIDVPIGFNAISKSGSVDTANQTIRWTVNMDTRGQDIPDLKIYDLLVYENSINLGTVTGIPAGISSADLTPRYGLKYEGNITGSYTVNVIPIMQGGVQVADLLEVTGFSKVTANSFSFDTKVVDPNVFAGNKTTTMRNTATLFTAFTKLNHATANVNYTNRLLSKNLLNRAAISDPAAGVNAYLSSAASAGFDYEDKSAIFRLSVNADGIDLTNATNAAGDAMGITTLTDTLPAGWEFVEIDTGLDYLIFEGSGESNGTVTATDTTPDTVTGLSATISGDTATFTFDTLNQPYVILLKAKPTNDTIEDYFDSNKTTTARNDVTLHTENWATGVSDYQNVTVQSNIVEKNTALQEAGVLDWTVEYHPYDLSVLGNKLEDQLPLGIDLRTDSSGNLLFDGNIEAYEMSLNANGSYTLGASLENIEAIVSYDNATRILTFNIPDSTKGYRFKYTTDVTGEPGDVTNQVALKDNDAQQESTAKIYAITESDGMASFSRNGWIEITKIDESSSALEGVEFTLYALDGTTVIKQGLTGSDGTVRLKVIPDGEYILRETAAPLPYVVDSIDHSVVVSTEGSVVTSSIDGKTGADSNRITIQNFVVNTVGNLSIHKTVAGNAGDTDKPFDFTLTLSGTGSADSYSYIGYGVPSGTITSGDTFSIADGESITIVGLPKDIAYTITEADYTADGYVTTSTGETGTIVADATQTATFTNTRNIGSLMIGKTVTGTGADLAKQFEFTVTLSDTTTVYPYTGNGVPDGTIQSGDTILLADGQSITITDLLEGVTYAVTEADYSDEGYITTSTGETGTIVADATQTAAFTNTRNIGSLMISKTVTGTGADLAKQFEFTVTLSDTTTVYPYTGNGVPDGTIQSGDTILLADGQSITITDLLEGVTYAVTEADYSDEGYITTSTGATGVIDDSLETAAFTNSMIPEADLANGSESSDGANDDANSDGLNDGSSGAGGSDSADADEMPDLGGNQNVVLAKQVLLCSLILIGFFIVDFMLRKKRHSLRKRTR